MADSAVVTGLWLTGQHLASVGNTWSSNGGGCPRPFPCSGEYGGGDGLWRSSDVQEVLRHRKASTAMVLVPHRGVAIHSCNCHKDPFHR